jgi:hypothetical protein
VRRGFSKMSEGELLFADGILGKPMRANIVANKGPGERSVLSRPYIANGVGGSLSLGDDFSYIRKLPHTKRLHVPLKINVGPQIQWSHHLG